MTVLAMLSYRTIFGLGRIYETLSIVDGRSKKHSEKVTGSLCVRHAGAKQRVLF